MEFQEQLRKFQQKRNEAAERQGAIMKFAGDEGRTLDDEESAEYDGITTEIKHIDEHLARLRVLIGEDTKTGTKEEAKSQGPTVFVRKQDPDDAFEGQSYVRRVIAKAMAQISGYEMTASQIAEQRWGKSHPNLVRVIKAGVTSGSAYGDSTDAWGTELVSADSRYVGDFVEFLKAQTIFDRLPLREVPANVTVKGQDSLATGYWVGESMAIKVSDQGYTDVSLTPKKVAAISVVSRELLRYSSPAAERLVRDALVEASRQIIDSTFIGAGAASGATPAGLLNANAGAFSSEGTDADGLRGDIQQLYAPFLAAKNASGLYFVMTPTMAKSIALMRNALGQREFPELNAVGGTLEGDPVITGDNVGSTHLILLKPADIWKIGDTGVEVSLSMDATIEQDDAPQGDAETPVAASATLMSMFQTESVAFKVVRHINYAKRRTHAVQYVSDAVYNTTAST